MKIECSLEQAKMILRTEWRKKYKKITYCPVLGIAYLWV